MFHVIGIDLASRATGMAALAFTEAGHLGTRSTTLIKGAGPVRAGKKGNRLELANRVSSLRRTSEAITNQVRSWGGYGDWLVCIEACAATGNVAGAMYERGHLWWRTVESLLLAAEVTGRGAVVAVPPSSVKVWAAGRGDANKREMLAAVNANWPQLGTPDGITDHNIADAISLATMGAAFAGCESAAVVTGAHPRALAPLTLSLPVARKSAASAGEPSKFHTPWGML